MINLFGSLHFSTLQRTLYDSNLSISLLGLVDPSCHVMVFHLELIIQLRDAYSVKQRHLSKGRYLCLA